MNDLLKDLLIIDIETVSGNEDIQDLAPEIQQHWHKKTQFIHNEEEKSVTELYAERAAIYAEFGKVIVIGIGFFFEDNSKIGLRVKSLSSHNESKLLSDFKELLENKFDPQKLKLCVHNGKEFDYPYLCRRMLVNGIIIPRALNMSGKKPWEVKHLDTMEMWKFGDRKNFTSLDLLTSIFDIPSSKQDMEGSRVTKTYYEKREGLDQIAKYCRKDIIATSQIFLKLNSLPIISEDQIIEIE